MFKFSIIKPFTIKRILRLSLVIFLVITACNNRNNVPFPADETVFSKPAIKPFTLSEPKKIKWTENNSDTIRPAEVSHFDFSKAPYKPIETGVFKPLASPAGETKFDWNTLPDTIFDIEKLEEKNLEIKTSLLAKPEIIPILSPKITDDKFSGLRTLGGNQGLPAMKIEDLIQDSYGLIWFICNGKLYQYDGNYLQSYPIEGNPSLIRIMEDRSGLLWIGADRGQGLYIADTRAGILRHVDIPHNIFTILQDKHGLFWVGARDAGVFLIDWENKKIRNYRRSAGDVFQNSVLEIIEDRQDRIWMVGGGGASIINKEQNKIRFLSVANGLHSERPWTLHEDIGGKIWIGSRDETDIDVINPEAGLIQNFGRKEGLNKNGISVQHDREQNTYIIADSVVYVLDRELKAMKKIITNEKYKDEIWIGHVFIDKNDQLWVGTKTGGVLIIDTRGIMARHFNKSHGLSGSRVWGLREDSQKQIWIGGAYEQDIKTAWLNMIDSRGEKVFDYTKGINHPFFNCAGLAEDKRGKMIFGALGSGVEILDPASNTITHYGREQGLLADNMNYLMQDRDGLIWMALIGQGIAVLDPTSGKIKYSADGSELNSLQAIYNLVEDSEKQIWIGSPDGFFVIDSSKSFMTHWASNVGLNGTASNNFAEDEKKRMWVATDNGLTVIDNKKMNYLSISRADGLIDKAAFALQKVNYQMYVGTGNGLTIFAEQETGADTGTDEMKWKVSSYGRQQGLLHTDFHTINMLTTTGQLWFAMEEKVLTMMNQPKEDTVLSQALITSINILDRSEDFSDRRLIDNSLNNGDTLWIGLKTNFYLKGNLPPDTGYLQKNKIKWDSNAGPYNLPVNLQLPYTQNYLSFNFNSADFNNRDKIRYRYTLEGIDKNWSLISDKPFSENYRDLPSGKYTFKVCARGANGLWSRPAELSFTILPPWWKTWWAFLLYALIIGLSIWSVIQYRSRWLKEENQRLEQMVKQRTNELTQSLTELKATQTQLIQSEKMASLGELTAGIAHEIQNPLNFVNNFSEVNTELIEEMLQAINIGNPDEVKTIAKDINENNFKIAHHGKRADSIVKGMLQHSRSSSTIKELTDINGLVDEYLRLSYHGLRAKDKSFNAILQTDFDKSIGNVSIIPQDIGRALLNLYNNAFYAVNEKRKYSSSSEANSPDREANGYEPMVSVSTCRIPDKSGSQRIEISVKDNGNGIPKKVIDKIFQPFFTTKPTGQGTGLGLSLTYDIVKSHGGEIKIDTKPGEYTEFIVVLPC